MTMTPTSAVVEAWLIGGEHVHQVLDAWDYFDSFDEGVDDVRVAVAKYGHAIEYLSLSPRDVSRSRILVCGSEGQSLEIIETFWGSGPNRIIWRRDSSRNGEIADFGIVEIHTSEGVQFLKLVAANGAAPSLQSHAVLSPSDELSQIYPAPEQKKKV